MLIPSYSVQGTGNQRKIVADVEWTFPLDFVEVVWGDGQRTDRQIISTTEAGRLRPASLRDSVRCDRQEMGALCRVGCRGQRRAGAADQAEFGADLDEVGRVRRGRRRRGRGDPAFEPPDTGIIGDVC